ncbi:MAG: hypothetical protein AB3N24_12260 [Leisingera sp.]
MLLFVFAGFLIGFALSIIFVRRPKSALIWGTVLGVVPLALMLGPGNAPVQGIGSILNFAFFSLGPLMLVPCVVFSIALGVAAGAAVLWIRQGRARWVGLTAGALLVGASAALTLLPVAQREAEKRQLAEKRAIRSGEIKRADFSGTMAGYEVAFPASPRLHLFHNCRPDKQGCSTGLTNPVDIFTKQDEELLHERSDPIRFRIISISAVETDCRLGEYCLTQEKIEHWCREVRPDQFGSIWCRDIPPKRFDLRTDAAPGPSDRDEPELAEHYADTSLGPGQVACFYHPDPAKTDRQGAGCRLSFDLADGVTATLSVRRAQILSGDPVLSATIALIPVYWETLTQE